MALTAPHWAFYRLCTALTRLITAEHHTYTRASVPACVCLHVCVDEAAFSQQLITCLHLVYHQDVCALAVLCACCVSLDVNVLVMML